MKRIWVAWAVFAAAAAGMLAVMAWGTAKILDLAAAEERARATAALEESVRLALWRMETALAALVIQENARPYEGYASGTGPAVPMVKQRFQLDGTGRMVAGRLPDGFSAASLSAAIPRSWLSVQNAQTQPPAPPLQAPAAQSQMARNVQEYQARGQLNMQNANILAPLALRPATAAPPAVEVKTGIMTAAWIGEELVLARHVQIGTQQLLQGCAIDLAQARAVLLASIQDLLPAASLIAERGRADPAEGRTLASLPLRLVPGKVESGASAGQGPLRFSLRIAWAAMVVAIAAVGLLLLGAISLSQRRAAFVSAVTHELRTPLTTFRMYTEMLVEGMAPDPAKQQEYHRTLYRESGRLMHLVENVLSYARLERGRYGATEVVPLGELMDRIRARLAEHTTLAGMELDYTITPEAAAGKVNTDAAAIERILFNLTDNACKYARDAADRRIHIDVAREGTMARITVRDHGPGIPGGGRRLFQTFRKTSAEAAKSAPGVGIGLALSRRLAQAAGGRLRNLESVEGACLLLELPLVK